MSGLAVIFGQSNDHQIQAMFEKIKHRGPEIFGISENAQVSMAQNYLKADIDRKGDKPHIPHESSTNKGLRICYDGLIGNVKELAKTIGITDEGPFLEERILLKLYEAHGPKMMDYLSDAIFSFVISDGTRLFVARDVLGIKTLFYGKSNSGLYFGSELKSVVAVTDNVYEFPAGYYMDKTGKLTQYAKLPDEAPQSSQKPVDELMGDIYGIIKESIENRVRLTEKTGGLLSGGIDSSVINYMASKMLKEKYGDSAVLKTFALGVGESQDIKSARVMANFMGSEHHEMIIGLDEMMEVMPDVIYYLESFDPSLVRSSVSNYLISRYAREQGVEELLSGEGGDEIFCGYIYLKKYPLEELFARQMECMSFLHSNASLRLDRMNAAHGVRVVAPLISGKLLDYVLRVPSEYKQKPEGDDKIEKWIFRKTFENRIPGQIAWRLKQEFSQGSGSADVLPSHFENLISDDELAAVQKDFPLVRSKEELHYFNLFTKYFGHDKAVKTVGQWVSL